MLLFVVVFDAAMVVMGMLAVVCVFAEKRRGGRKTQVVQSSASAPWSRSPRRRRGVSRAGRGRSDMERWWADGGGVIAGLEGQWRWAWVVAFGDGEMARADVATAVICAWLRRCGEFGVCCNCRCGIIVDCRWFSGDCVL